MEESDTHTSKQASSSDGGQPSLASTQRLLDVIAGRAANMSALGTVFEANTRSAAAQQLLDHYDTLGSRDERVYLFFLPLALSVAEAARRLSRKVASLPQDFSSHSQAACLMQQLHEAQTSDVVHFMRALARTSGGTRRLLSLRSDLRQMLTDGNRQLRKMKQSSLASPGGTSLGEELLVHQREAQSLLMYLDAHVKSLISGQILARLSPIGAHSPASVLAFLATAERVHPPSGSADIMRRVGGDEEVQRFCYGLFMPGMASRPLAFVLSALLPSIPDSIQAVLQGDERGLPGTRNTAVFYSITNCFPGGLQGLGLGSHLLLSALRALSSSQQRDLRDVVTLSPIPSMAAALKQALQQQQPWALPPQSACSELVGALVQDTAMVRRTTAGAHAAAPNTTSSEFDACTVSGFIPAALDLLLALDAAAALGDEAAAEALAALSPRTRDCMLFWSARHVLFGRPVRSTSGLSKSSRVHRASDPVTNFHASNGASVARLNAGANSSVAGILRAYGCMVNYRYNLLGRKDSSTAQLLQLLLAVPTPEEGGQVGSRGGAGGLAAQPHPTRRRPRPWWSAVAGVTSRLFSNGGGALAAPPPPSASTFRTRPSSAVEGDASTHKADAGLMSIASATGYRLIGQLAVTGFAVLVHAVTPVFHDGVVEWPPLLQGIYVEAVRNLKVQACFARVLQGSQESIVLSDPAVQPGGTVCLVAMGSCEQWSGGVKVRTLATGEHCTLGFGCDNVVLPTSHREREEQNCAGVLLISAQALLQARRASEQPVSHAGKL